MMTSSRSLACRVGALARALAATRVVCPAAAPAAAKEGGFWTQAWIWGCMRVVGQEADKERCQGKAEWAGGLGGRRAERCLLFHCSPLLCLPHVLLPTKRGKATGGTVFFPTSVLLHQNHLSQPFCLKNLLG